MARAVLLLCLLLLLQGVFGARLPTLSSLWTKYNWPEHRHPLSQPEVLKLTTSSKSHLILNRTTQPNLQHQQLSAIRSPAAQQFSDPYLATVFSPTAHKVLPKLKEDSNVQFDLAKAKLFAKLTSISYCDSPYLLDAWNCTRCVNITDFKPHTVVWDPTWDLMAYVGYYAPLNGIVTAFRGTDSSSWGNWIENMRSWRTDHMYPVPENPHAMIHSGFYLLWTGSTLQPMITQAVGEILKDHPDSALYSIGHSMGGAVAQLCALDLKFHYNFTYVASYTYGSPRVGNAAYQDLFNYYINESWRFTHNRDIVPSVPLQLMGFHHVAREVWVVDVESGAGVSEKVLMCDETGEDPSCHNSACYLGICTSIADHLVYLGIHMYQDDDGC